MAVPSHQLPPLTADAHLVSTLWLSRIVTLNQLVVCWEDREMQVVTSCLVIIVIVASLPVDSKAQAVHPLTIGDALGTHSFFKFSNVAFSPDGKWLAYTVSDNRQIQTTDTETKAKYGVLGLTMGADVYVLNVLTGQTINLTSGIAGNWRPSWSPDGHYLAFLSNRDDVGRERLWLWDAGTNSLRKISNIDVRGVGTSFEWLSGSKNLLVSFVPSTVFREARSINMPNEENQGKERSNASPSSVNLYRSERRSTNDQATPISDPWNLDYYLNDLAVIGVASGEIRTLVHGRKIAKYVVSPDGSRIAYTSPTRFERPGSQQMLFDLVTIDLATDKEHVVASDIRLNIDGAQFSWAPNGQQLSFRSGGMEERIADCYVVGADGHNKRNITNLSTNTNSQYTTDPPVWDPQGTNVYFIDAGALWRASLENGEAVEVSRIPHRQITHILSRSSDLLWTPDGGKSTVVLTHDDSEKQDGFYRVELEVGTSIRLLESGQCYTCVNHKEPVIMDRDGKEVAYFVEDAQHDSDLWIADPDFHSPRRLTHLNPQFDRYVMGAARLVEWRDLDGDLLHGALLLPANYQEGKSYPLIVWAYGGNHKSDFIDKFGFDTGPFNFQLLATRGYAVLVPDAPQHLGTPMLDLAKTILPGVNKIIEMGIADPDRLGVMGQSYGGYSTLALIVQTKRFRAAVEVDGYGDIIGAYGEMARDGTSYELDIQEQGQGLMGGTPWQSPDRYIQNSPVFFLERIETPLLIVHGTEDTAVLPFLGDEVFVDLRRLGKEVEYAKYQGEDHDPRYWRYTSQVDFCNRMIEWFDAHIKTNGHSD